MDIPILLAAWASAAALLLRAHLRVRALSGALASARHEAAHDPLTGLLNRRAFYAAAGEIVAAPDHRSSMLAVVDLDDFKRINDSYGHVTGDTVLIAAARQLRDLVGDAGLVARLGGDEFAALLHTGATANGDGRVELIAAELRDAASKPVRVQHSVALAITVGASVGVVPVEAPAVLAEVLGRADAAMYRAKSSGLGTAVFDPRIDDHSTPIPGARASLRVRDLRSASDHSYAEGVPA